MRYQKNLNVLALLGALLFLCNFTYAEDCDVGCDEDGVPVDTDGDGFNDQLEFEVGSDPENPVIAAGIVNIDATANNDAFDRSVTLNLLEGVYFVQAIGNDDGAPFDAWNAWSAEGETQGCGPLVCEEEGAFGWINWFWIDSAETGLVFYEDGTKWAAPDLAVLNAPEYSFEITYPQEVTFANLDYCEPEDCDNAGGISLYLLKEIPDSDGDGVPDDQDQCPGYDDSEDVDGDGIPDNCDMDDTDGPLADADGDGVANGDDACPGFDDALDADDDGIADGCDDDDDNDGVSDEDDACPGYNDEDDADGDGIPDACDDDGSFDDADGDGVSDEVDACPDSTTDVVDAEGCSGVQIVANSCPADADYRNHGQYVRCVVRSTRSLVWDGLLTRAEKRRIVRAAAASDIGKKKRKKKKDHDDDDHDDHDDHDDKKDKKKGKKKDKKGKKSKK